MRPVPSSVDIMKKVFGIDHTDFAPDVYARVTGMSLVPRFKGKGISRYYWYVYTFKFSNDLEIFIFPEPKRNLELLAFLETGPEDSTWAPGDNREDLPQKLWEWLHMMSYVGITPSIETIKMGRLPLNKGRWIVFAFIGSPQKPMPNSGRLYPGIATGLTPQTVQTYVKGLTYESLRMLEPPPPIEHRNRFSVLL